MEASQCVRNLKAAYEILKRRASEREIKDWIKRGTTSLRWLGQLLRRDGVPIGEKQHIIRCIGQVKCIQTKLGALQRVGGGGGGRVRSGRVRWHDLESAFESRLRTGVIVNLVHRDTTAFLDDAQALFTARIRNALRRHNALKVNAVLEAEYRKVSANGEEVVEDKSFNTANASIIQTTDLAVWFTDHIRAPILRDMEEFQERDSGWTLHSITSLAVHINRYNPMRGSSFIRLPLTIHRKKACVNVINEDDQCFKWAVLSALHPADRNTERISNYRPYEHELNFDGMEFPIRPKDVGRFEQLNNISINVYVLLLKGKSWQYVVAPVHITSGKRDRHINLLLIQDKYSSDGEEEPEGEEETEVAVKYHYVWIKNLSRLVSTQLSKKDGKKHICDRCLHYFLSAEKLQLHEVDCRERNKCRVTLPSPQNATLKFKNFNYKEKVPFCVYADFECLLRKPEGGQTNVRQEHEAFSVGYYFKCSYDDTLSRYGSYRGEQPAEWFARELQQLAEDVETVFWCPLPMERLTVDEEQSFRRATVCHICEGQLHGKVVRDHCHLTGRYRGPAHEDCNLNYQDSRMIPVVFHNLSGYDAHFIIKEIATCFEGRLNILPVNMERYISFTKHVQGSEISFRFVDSLRFMASSLEKLASYLPECRILRSQFLHLDDERFKLLTRKGVFPYEFLDSWEKLESTQELPPKELFYSELTNTNVSAEDYEHAEKVWATFGIGSLGEYSDLYLKTDVLLLADVFENFRENCLKAYGLDPAHYYTTPGLTWDAMLKYTKVELELLTDIDMLLFVERGIRGGISQCSNRYSRANNRYMPDYDPEKPSTYLMYYDVNNLYGFAMQQYLPYGYFKWVDAETTDWRVSDESPVGYFLEVDLEYPRELHDKHRDLPMCSEHKRPPGSKDAKLLTTLDPKTRYVIHYRSLRQAVDSGLRITKIHRVLQFGQSPWLKKYIDLNTAMRTRAGNEFEKNLYKLMNNAVFGKTMENVRKRATIKLVTKWGGRYGAEALIAKPNFHSRAIFSEDLVAIRLTHLDVLLNKPIYVGAAVLDLSKTCVYEFHYAYMLAEHQERAKLLYTDTDSLIYELRCEDAYSVMRRDIDRFDTSDYPADNPYGMPLVNKKVVGLMKDECCGRIMTEFVGLRSKMYSIRVEGQDTIKKAKGVKAGVVKQTICFDDYTECLRHNVTKERRQYLFQSRLHQVRTIRQDKIALSPHDDKRCLLPDTTDTLPWGHYRLAEMTSSQTANDCPNKRRKTE